jgi:hypothetical protein
MLHAGTMPLRRSGRLRPEELLTTSEEARSYLWSVLLTLLPFVVLVGSVFSGGDEFSGVRIIALFVFAAGAISGNLLINRIVRRLGRPRSAFSYWLLRNRVGFALWPLRAIPHAIRLARSRGDEVL